MAKYYIDLDGKLKPYETTTTKKNEKSKKKKKSSYYVDFDGKVKKYEEDIAPVKETNERTWFTSGAFDDGYQFGDITKTILGTTGDLGANILGGALEIGEGVVDAGAYLAGGTAKLFGADKFAEKTKKFIADDLYRGDEVAARILTAGAMGADDIDQYSVLGEKLDSIAQSGGQLAGTIALQYAGVPWWLTSGVTSFGKGTEEAFSEGADYLKAGGYGLVSAASEILTEKLFGGSGLGEKGLINLDGLTNGISNKVVKAIADLGVDMASEGAEEVVSSVATRLGSALYKEENISELLGSEEAFDEYLESFIGGAVLGGVMNASKGVRSAKNKTDYRTGITANEQKVFDAEYKKRIEAKEKDGKKLSKNEKAKIYDDVLEDLKEGGISTDAIAEVLGGDSYKAYQEAIEKDNQAISELESIYDGEGLTKAKEEILKNSERETLKAKMNEDVFNSVKGSNDQYLVESYKEVARKGQDFKADLTKYGDKQKKVIQNAIDAGFLNNTNKTHKMVNWIAKISADKGIEFDFANNEKLIKSGFAVEGKTVNGYVENGKITLNLESAKALESTVGHEITHVLEGTELYETLQKALFEYAKVKGEYETRLRDAMNLYKGVKGYEGANGVIKIQKEVAADLVGDYLFQDTDFIRKLHAENRNVFQKVWDEIKYLCKIATAGSQEARQLAKVQKAFEDVYRESVKAEAKTEVKGEGKYSLSAETDKAYMEAVEKGDTATAQKMVYEAANKAMPDSILREGKAIEKGEDEGGTLVTMYHGSGAKGFNVFETNDGMLGKGIYLTSNWDEAVEYAIENLGIEQNDDGYYLWDGETYDGIGSIGEALEAEGYVRPFYANVTDENDIAKSSVYWEDVIALVRDNNQLKSADPITYDDNGNVIPLSERFNVENEDIRYSLTSQNIVPPSDTMYSLSAVPSHKVKLNESYSVESSTDLDTIVSRYDKIIDIWERLGGELDSKFLNEWNSKGKTDREFTVFKTQAGYKYNVELSTMCKKGVPLFEAIDTIVKKEVMKELDIDRIGKEEKEILYDILKQHNFEIPCAICYVEQARQREGVIIDAFLHGKVESGSKGKVKLGWNNVLQSVEQEMKANGVDFVFPDVSRDIATDVYSPTNITMDEKTESAFYEALRKIANKEITRYNKAEKKDRKLLKKTTPEAVKECFKGTLPSNLKIFKVLFTEPSSRFKIGNDLLYSSLTTQNLAKSHNALYGLFNSQGGVSGYKSKQGTTAYWGDILGKKWNPSTLRKEGGVRNQSNSDFQMFTLLDQAQMYIDFTAKGYYLQAYTKVLSELKLFGLSKGKINASLIPKVVVYKNADGSVDVKRTMENAGLDEDGNPIYDDVEGINHTEAFMLIDDPDYSKNISGICIGYSDNHIWKLLDDNRVQQIIGFHDKTDDPNKRYVGARYAKNYNGLNEAVKDNGAGETVHIGFNTFVKNAEKKFKYNKQTDSFEGTIQYNGKTYVADDIPKLAADLYLEMCEKKNYKPAYDDFKGHENYYKLLADFGLYDSEGHYAPHRKVEYDMPDQVPYLDANGNKQYVDTYEYIKQELSKELAVRDSIAEAMADTSEEGILYQFKERVKELNKTLSLSEENAPFKQYGNSATPSNELMVDKSLAPTTEDLAKPETEDVAPTKYTANSEEKPYTRQELHNGIIDRIKAKFAEKGFDFDKVLKKAKNLSTFKTVDNTPQRVMEKSLGYKEGQILSDLTVNKVMQNETEGIKWLNSFTDRKNGLLAKISKQYHIKPGSKESAAAQMYAEGFYVDENNDIIEYGDKELAKDFPNEKVRNNIIGLAKDKRIRQIYDETLAKINEARARNLYPEIQRLDNYFLHFRAMEDTFSRLGLPFNPNDIRAKDLPTDLNGVTADLKPGQPYFASAKHRLGKRTSFDLLGGLERYLSSAKNQIYHIDDIQTLRALRNYVADTYGQANGLEGLDSLTEEEAQERIKEVYGSHLSTFAKFLNEEANILAGKTSLIDRGLEGVIGRRGITFLDNINKQVGANMVGFNASSSLTNFLAGVQAIAKTNKLACVKSLAQMTQSKIGSIFGKVDAFVENNPTIIRRKGIERFYRAPYQKFGDAGYVLMSAVDEVTTEFIVRAKYNEFIQNGMSEQQAVIEADKWTSRLMGDRSLGQMPQLYNSKMLGLVTKFQLEVRNQLDSQFYDTIQEAKASNEQIENGLVSNAKTAAKVTSSLFQLAVLQHLFGKAFESVAGYNPAFDIVSVLATALGFDDDEESEDTALDNIEQGFLELLEDLPYTSTFTGGRIPISSALPIEELVKGVDQYGNEKSRLETLKEVAPYYVLPGGYGQIKKTKQGLSMFSEEHPVSGSYSEREKEVSQKTFQGNGKDTYFDLGTAYIDPEYEPIVTIDGNVVDNYSFDYENGLIFFTEPPAKKAQISVEFRDSGLSMRFPVEDTFGNRLQAGIFGQYASKNAREYFDNDVAPLNAEQIKEYRDLEAPIGDYWDYRKGLSGLKTIAEKADYINSLDLADWQKNLLINNIANRKEAIDMTNYDNYGSFEEFDYAQKNPEKYALATVVGGYEPFAKYSSDLNDIEADKDSNGKTISGSRKKKVMAYIESLDIDRGQKLILHKSQYKSDTSYNRAIIEYLKSRDDISIDQRKTILTELGFNVSEDGTVRW